MGYVTIENKTREECTEDAFKANGFAKCSTHKKHRHNEDELHHSIAITAQKPACELRHKHCHGATIKGKLKSEKYPKHDARAAVVRGDNGCQRDKCHKQRYH